MSASQYSPFLKSNEVSEAGIEIIQSGETASVWTMHLSGTQAFLVPDSFENLEDLLKLQNWNKILSCVVLQMLKMEVFFGNFDHCGMLELPQKIVFLMVYWWWWVCDVSTKNGPHKLVFFLVVIGGAILLSASKIFAWDYVKHGRKDTTSKVQLCIKDHLSVSHEMFRISKIFQNCLDHKVLGYLMRSTRGWNDKLLCAAVSHQSNET